MNASPQRLRLEEIGRIDAELDALAGPGHPASGLTPGTVSTNGVAVAGEEGFLFIGDGANRWERQFLGELTIGDDWFEGWRRLFEARQAQASARGIGLWNLVAPEKQVLLPHMRWPPAERLGAGRPLRRLQAVLPEAARLLYPEAVMRAAQGLAPSYFRHNSHWTPSGCCAAAGMVLEAMSAPAIGDLAPSVQRGRGAQDLTAHFFDPPPEEDWLLLAPAGEVTHDNRHLELTGRHAGSLYVLHNSHAPDPRRVILFGDSYAYDAGLSYALSAAFADVVFVWAKSVIWDLVDQHHADLVLWQSAERFLATLPLA